MGDSTQQQSRFCFFEDMPVEVQALGRRRLLQMSDRQQFPPYTRLSPHSPPFWSAEAVSHWFWSRLARVETFDGEPTLVR